GGEAFEGLDEASELGTGIIIVVNDNEMSIAENHGGIYKNLRALRKSNGTCEHNWFKAWGFDYKYLEQGNDIAKLIDVFRSVKDTDRPTVVHIHTEKGHGYAPAVQNKEAWHWGLPFNLDDGSRPVRNADGSMPDVAPAEDYAVLFSDWMLREMKLDPTLIAVTAGTPAAGGFTAAKRKEAGSQHIDMGIAEEQAVAMISGMAKGGLHPVWTVYSTFIQRTYDQIAQDLCINANPAVINVVGGGVRSMNDITHICLFDIPMLCGIPGLVYLAPTTCEEYFAMLRWAIKQEKTPVALRVPTGEVVHTTEQVDAEYACEPQYKVAHRGSKVAVVAAGSFYQKGESVVGLLAEKGIDATLINPRYLNDVDAATLDALKPDHQLVVTLEDGCKDGGFGERIAAYYGTSDMKVLVCGVKKGLYDRFDVEQLLSDNRLLDEQSVEDALAAVGE
ncbi:MAG: 1-deoxy-D-xylulose-5-phosphate synthase, partial [Prevotella sp.]|uniref:1-deoxy-D-xylulose-5-phosphate synthase n=1 Tax=Leyella stercorea TaxID=363265 RepID=UPI0028028EB0|nr:1-deoxy-D-xylulose-5-phosphate synthase [Leyella stercorea]MDY4198089.1 1-deoxy-D-xylulose-5-phosphate synthase [Prevotella sp.]